jgi:S-adenosylmethionine hydrolase
VQNSNGLSPETDNVDEPAEKLENVSFKCTPATKSKVRAAIKTIGGAQFGALATSLLERFGFRFEAGDSIVEIEALKTCVIQLHNDYVERITAVLDELGKQVTSSKDHLSKSVTDAATMQLAHEQTVAAAQATIHNLVEKNAILLRESTASNEALQNAKHTIEILKQQNLEKSLEIGRLQGQVDAQLETRFSGIEDKLRKLIPRGL